MSTRAVRFLQSAGVAFDLVRDCAMSPVAFGAGVRRRRFTRRRKSPIVKSAGGVLAAPMEKV
jgi:hypothetical protein